MCRKLVLLLLLVAIIPSHQQQPEAPPDLVETTCNQTPYKDMCKFVLGEAPKTETTEICKLAKFFTKMVSLAAAEIHGRIQNLTNSIQLQNDEVKKQCLRDCSVKYKDAADQLENVLVALDSGNYKDMKTYVTVAMDNVKACEAGLEAKSKTDLVSTALNNQFTKLCEIILSLLNIFPKA